MIKALATKNVAAVLLTISMVLGFAFAFATPAKADVLSDLQAQVQALLAQIAALQGSSSTGSMMSSSCFTFTMNHKQGSTGGEVMEIQKFLNSHGFTVSASGAGSAGNETSYFGAATKAAVIKFQNAYASDILTPVGLTAGNGNWYAGTRAKANSLCVSGPTTTTPTTPTTPTAGGAVSVMAGSQPANSLAPKGASQVPFTTFTLTNTSNAAVTVNSVTIQRTGLANDAAFAGVILTENSMRIGNTKTFNSNHQATLDASATLQPGQSRTFTVAGDMASDQTSYSGQVVSISVTGVNTSSTVSGSLPIVGASHTINNSLTVGTLTVRQGPSDPDSTTLSKEIGTAAYVAASINATAGSAENVWVKSIRWNQSGSASASDIANVVTVIDGTSYPTNIDATGKYYSVVFPGNGIKIEKGNTKEIIVKLDVIGGANRNANIDIYKAGDIYAVGEIYGFGVTADADANTASASTDASEFVTSDGTASGTSGTPFFSGSQIDITAGSVTSFSRANEVAAQNVAENASNQPLGGFAMDVKGEGITVQQMIFYLTETGSAADGADITSVSLVDENGLVVAGPVDGALVSGSNGKVTFTDTVTFPTGRHVFTLKGKLGTDFANGDTVVASTTPSSDWTTIRGASTGDTISLSALSSVVSGNTMTLRTGAVVLSINSSPAAQNVVAGVSGQTFGQINFDATNSGEDVKFTSAKFYFDPVTTLVGGAPTNCHVWDGATRLTSSPVNLTTSTAAGDQTFTFDTNLVVAKGTTKIVAIKCDLGGSASSGAFAWDLNTSSGNATFDGIGVNSGVTITPTTPSSSVTDGNTQTVATGGALTIAEDSSSPAYKIAAGGTTGVTIGVLRFNGTNEDMRLDRVGLILTGVAATSTPSDITQVTLWDGATQVGTAIFSGSNRYATSSLTSTNVIVPANSFKNLTVKADLAAIGTSQAGESGVLIQVDYDGESSVSAGGCSTRAYGVSSGSQICSTTSGDTSFDGVRMFRAYPTVAQDTPAGMNTTLTSGSALPIHYFKVTASNNGLGIALSDLTINIATSSASAVSGTTTVENLDVYAYTDSSYSTPVSGFTDGKIFDGTDGNGNSGDNEMTLSTVLQIPAGSTYYFKVVGDVTLTSGTGTFSGYVTTKLVGDSAFPVPTATLMLAQATLDALTSYDSFIWSPNSTTTAVAADNDWTNGYGVAGLPSAGLTGHTLSK